MPEVKKTQNEVPKSWRNALEVYAHAL